MSDAPREPLEPELLPRPSEGLPPLPGNPGDFDERWRLSAPPRPPKRKLALILFLLTCASTFYAGGEQFGFLRALDVQHRRIVPVRHWTAFVATGLTYSVGVLLILGAHEMGHYLQARRYGVPASLPMFIPMPVSPFGTMGAVIIQQAGAGDRKAMFDIAISGPLAGLVLALPISWWGIKNSYILTVPPGAHIPGYGDPLILKWIVRYYFGPLQANQDVVLNPVLFAGWVGVFITALNLMPMGQLDGGHILYCLIRRKAHVVARLFFFGAAAAVIGSTFFGQKEYTGWVVMLALIWMMGTRHPPTADDYVPLGWFRIILGWLTLGFIFIGFTPRPFV
jgi:membrane-associated protease RseP (regulator of RpoE activity)